MRRLTNIQFRKKADLIHNNEYEYLDEYVKSSIKILIKHKTCGYEFKQTPNDHLSKHGCPRCSGLEKLTNEIIDKRLLEQNRKIKCLGNCVNAITKIEWLCLEENCSCIWKTSPRSIINNKSGCPRCSKNERLTNEIVDERLKERKLKRNNNIINYTTKIEWLCLECEHIWLASPDNILNVNETGCPRCNSSHGELKVERFLKKILQNTKRHFKIQVRFKDCRNTRPLPFDFVVYNADGSIYCIIEYDGIHHFKEIHERKNDSRYNLKNYELIKLHDSIKTKYCLDNDIRLIRISYKDKNNIEEILIKELTIKEQT